MDLTLRARLPLRSGTENEKEKRNGTTHSYWSSAYPTARKQKQHGIRRNKRNSQKPKKTSCFKSMAVSRGEKKCLFRKNIIIRSHLASNNFCLKLSVMRHTSVWSWWKYTQRDKYVTETNLEWFSRFLAAHRWHFNLAQLKNWVRIYEISWVQF